MKATKFKRLAVIAAACAALAAPDSAAAEHKVLDISVSDRETVLKQLSRLSDMAGKAALAPLAAKEIEDWPLAPKPGERTVWTLVTDAESGSEKLESAIVRDDSQDADELLRLTVYADVEEFGSNAFSRCAASVRIEENGLVLKAILTPRDAAAMENCTRAPLPPSTLLSFADRDALAAFAATPEMSPLCYDFVGALDTYYAELAKRGVRCDDFLTRTEKDGAVNYVLDLAVIYDTSANEESQTEEEAVFNSCTNALFKDPEITRFAFGMRGVSCSASIADRFAGLMPEFKDRPLVAAGFVSPYRIVRSFAEKLFLLFDKKGAGDDAQSAAHSLLPANLLPSILPQMAGEGGLAYAVVARPDGELEVVVRLSREEARCLASAGANFVSMQMALLEMMDNNLDQLYNENEPWTTCDADGKFPFAVRFRAAHPFLAEYSRRIAFKSGRETALTMDTGGGKALKAYRLASGDYVLEDERDGVFRVDPIRERVEIKPLDDTWVLIPSNATQVVGWGDADVIAETDEGEVRSGESRPVGDSLEGRVYLGRFLPDGTFEPACAPRISADDAAAFYYLNNSSPVGKLLEGFNDFVAKGFMETGGNKDLQRTGRFLVESGLKGQALRWMVVSTSGEFKKTDRIGMFDFSVVYAIKHDPERVVKAFTDVLDEEDDPKLAETAVDGVKAWQVTSEEYTELGMEQYYASLDGQLIFMASSKELLAKEIALYKGKGNASKEFEEIVSEESALVGLYVANLGTLAKTLENGVPGTLAEVDNMIPNGGKILVDAKTLTVKLTAYKDGAVLSGSLSLKDEADANSLKSVVEEMTLGAEILLTLKTEKDTLVLRVPFSGATIRSLLEKVASSIPDQH